MKRILAFSVALCVIFSALSICGICFAVQSADTETSQSAGANAAAAEDTPLLAFPSAEGGGKYTKGARAALDEEGGTVEVYHVTNLNSDGPGSFTEAISADPVDETLGEAENKPPIGRIIVFDVGGVIDFPNGTKINRDYVTILGQTAPGDGITLTGGDLQIGNARKNVIIRYLRVRPTNKNGAEVDGMGGQWNSDVIIDHCSTSWCVDEGLTLYAGNVENSNGYEQGKRLTVQNTISSESMRMSGHFKGAHGYGAIIGGTNATYYRNLFAHHDSRSPRLDRILQKTDIRNNIIYNWGVTNSAYGGEPTSPHPGNARGQIRPSKINYSNNYYKYGPSTVEGKRYRIYDFKDLAKEVGKTYNKEVNGETVMFTVEKSQFYMEDNYVVGSQTVTDNNWANDGTNSAQNQVAKMTEPFSLGDDLYPDLNIPADKLLAGKDVMEAILPDIGATLPRRDSIDARVIADVKNQTGRIINNEEEVGGLAGIQNSERTFVIPEDWKTANNMGSAKDSDIVPSGVWAGYTWIEAYVNDWTEQQSKTIPTNPTVTVTSPAIASIGKTVNGQTVDNGNWLVIKDNQTVNYKASALPVGETSITKMELYDCETLIKTYDGAVIDDSISLGLGEHYLSCVAYNDKGESTRSTTSIVYVNGTNMPEGWTLTKIGSNTYSGKGAVSVDADGVYTMGGSGKIGGKADMCDFMYKEVTGDFDISLKLESIMANENGPVFGLMVREGLSGGDRMASLVDGWIKFGRNDRVVARTTKSSNIATDKAQTNSTDQKIGIFMTGKEGEIVSGNVLGEHPYDTEPTGKYHLPNYLRIQRNGNNLIFSVSDSGTDWTDNARQPYTMTISNLANKLYVGVAIDSQQGQSDASPKAYYSQAQFSELTLENDYTPIPSVTPGPTLDPDSYGKYGDWKIGQATETGKDGAAEVVNYEGKDAFYVTKRNVYKTFDTPISSGIADFDFDLYVDTSVDRNFRVYLENAESDYTVTDNVFAEIINNRGKKINLGPVLDEQTKTFFTYEQLGESQWVHFKAALDYGKADTDEFITLTATRADGTEIAKAQTGAISGKSTALKSVRLVQTAASAYFADMNIMPRIVHSGVYYEKAPSIDGNTVTASVVNKTDEKGVLFIAAAYENGMVAETKTVKIDKSDTAVSANVTFDKEYDDVRVYLWSSDTLEPYSNIVKVK